MDSRQIYVDYDDVLSETALAFTEVLKREFGKTVEFDDIFSFNLGESFGLSPAEVSELMDLFHEPDNLCLLQPVRGSIDALQQWANAGFEICVMTGRPPATHDVSLEWLLARGVPYSSLTFVDKYGRVNPPRTDVAVLSLDELCRRRFCVAVEDAPAMAGFLAQHMIAPVALLHRPWNAGGVEIGKEASRQIHTCRDWDEILQKFPPSDLARPGMALA